MDVILVMDESGSMQHDIASMKVFAKDVVDYFEPLGENDAKFGVISFATDAVKRTSFMANAAIIDSAIDDMVAEGWTSISDGLYAAGEMFAADHRPGATKIVLTLSDGEQTTDCLRHEDCKATCYGASCDYWHAAYSGTISCSTLEGVYGCDCSDCACDGTGYACTDAAISAAEWLKAQSVTVFSWGFGGVSTATLELLASGED